MQQVDKPNKRRKIGPYLLIKPIGRGSYSVVFQAQKQSSKQKFAIKQISLVNIRKKELERIHREIQVLKLIKHQNIVSLIDYKQTVRNLYLVFEHCKHTDLDLHIQKYYNGRLPEEQVQKIAIQIKRAFIILRKNKVVHRDLKLANILVTEDFEIKLADFGFAKFLDQDAYFKSYVGTPLTMAPQILENQQYNQKCDLWSLGVVFYQMLFGKNPFFTQEKMTLTELKKAVKNKIHYPLQVSNQAKDIISRLIVTNPNQRISFDQFFQHKWLQDSGPQHDDLYKNLKDDALRDQLRKNLAKSSRGSQEKNFIIQKAEQILAYSIIQFTKSVIQNKLMYWVNLGKKIAELNPQNKKITFFSIAVILDNIRIMADSEFSILVNDKKILNFPNYQEIRKYQTWQMSEFTKRLPKFLQKSVKNLKDNLGQLNFQCTGLDKKNKLIKYYLQALTQQMQANPNHPSFASFAKVKPWEGQNLNIRVTSQAVGQKSLRLLLSKMNLKVTNHKLLKKCSHIFKIERVYHESALQKFYQALKFRYC